MGACSARIFERGNAGRLIGIGAGRGARIDIGHAKRSVLPRVEIGVEDAVAAAELQLDAVAFLNLKRRATEMPDQILGGEAGQARDLALRLELGDGGRGLLDRLLRAGGAGGEQEDRSES